MKRRSFLGSFAAFAAGMVLDPEQLLWVPGKKVISIPTLHGGVLPAIMNFDSVHIPGICEGERTRSRAESIWKHEGGESFIGRMMSDKRYRLATASEVQEAIKNGCVYGEGLHACTPIGDSRA